MKFLISEKCVQIWRQRISYLENISTEMGNMIWPGNSNFYEWKKTKHRSKGGGKKCVEEHIWKCKNKRFEKQLHIFISGVKVRISNRLHEILLSIYVCKLKLTL